MTNARLGRRAAARHWECPERARLLEGVAPVTRARLARLRLPAADADDLVQEVAAVVARRLPEFEGAGRPGAFAAWVREIAARTALRHRRDAARRPAPAGDALDALPDPAPAPDEQAERADDRRALARLLARAAPEFGPAAWAAFRATTLAGRPAREVLRDLGLTPNAVRLARSRVLARLRAMAAGAK